MIELINLSWKERVDISLECETFFFQSKNVDKFRPLHRELMKHTSSKNAKEVWLFLTAACKAVRYGATGSKFALSKERYYDANKKYKLKISHKKSKEMLCDFEQADLITFYRGFKDEEWSMESCFLMRSKLLNLIPEKEAKRYALVRQPEEFLRIKDYNTGTYITDYRGIGGIRLLGKEMLKFNEFIHKQVITIDGKLARISYVRIFADNLKGAGRFYTTNGFMNHDKHLRETITINGNEATECDFSTLHPRLIATLKGIKLNADWKPYSLSKRLLGILSTKQKQQLRKLCKKALMCCLYSESLDVATKSLFREYNMNKGDKGIYKDLPPLSKETCESMLLDLQESNKEISDWFFNKDGWKVLQNMDSKLCAYIVKNMTYLEKTCLPYHDSWVCEVHERDTLVKFMEASWVDMFGTSMNFKYDVEF